jgi:hypothetical protein
VLANRFVEDSHRLSGKKTTDLPWACGHAFLHVCSYPNCGIRA